MAKAEENPYRPPSEKSTPFLPSRITERLKCPVCCRQTFPYWKVYFFVPGLPFRCRNCDTKLKLAKFGFGQLSSFVVALPCAMFGAIVTLKLLHPDFRSWTGEFDNYLTIYMFLVVLFVTLAVDFLVDKHYVYVRNPQDLQR